ncbi:E3 ubiquitin-protein ligase APD3-like [Impatiens glandulifera]|uniref:E3 ubiquitin-protein ligase APD3-like n=1 Tax=Impatiens glandulifera TaxID=253017 RepID=UPI001FB1899C|nr:E3 ubiquitin-protein ligase APD3-like [Impatiens glandulifera]
MLISIPPKSTSLQFLSLNFSLTHTNTHTQNMYRPMLETAPFITSVQPIRWQDSLARLLVPLLLLISVCGILKYGYFEDCRVLMGPGSSRLIKTNSLFLREMEVRDRDKKGVLVYRFSDKPRLSLQKNWNLSKSLNLPVNGEKGFFLWLNKGSRVHIRLEGRTSITSFDQMRISLIKGNKIFV